MQKINDPVYKEKVERLYINQNLDIKEVGSILSISYSTVYRILIKYNINKPRELAREHRSNKFARFDKSFWDKRNEKSKRTLQQKYGKAVINPFQIPNIQKRTHLPASIQKAYETKRKNNTFNTSKVEEEIFNRLCSRFDIIKRNYKSEKYPFKCDFYIQELDLYIEYQGTWTHGFDGKNLIGPYINNKICKKVLRKWAKKAKISKYYAKAIEVWTIRDPLKRKVAKENNLNWLEFFTMKEFENWFKNLQ